MKFLIFVLIFSVSAFSSDEIFVREASLLAEDLKKSLMQNLSEKISKDGVVEAVPYCHGNVSKIAKGAAKDRMSKFEFGRTSHKVRNTKNSPELWAESYLKEFQGKKKGEMNKSHVLHKLENGKRIYLGPLFIEAKCLMCHGDKISENVSTKIKELYPEDKATGFELGQFRGFIWVMEK